MAISGFIPTTALPGAAPGSSMLPGAAPLATPGLQPGSLLPAHAGATERPGIGHRLLSAMRAAVGELRGVPGAPAQADQQTLALHAQAALGSRDVGAPAERPRTARKVKSAKSWKTLANPPRAAVAAGAAGAAGVAGMAGAAATQQAGPALPVNATQLPGATVYSYDGTGAPVAPTMQQLGVNPAMLQGLTGMAQAVDPEGPQLNATNQTNLSGMAGIGAGAGLGLPVLGQPIHLPPVTSPGDTTRVVVPPAGTAGGTQAVTNRNTTDVSNRSHGFAGMGFGGYGNPYDPTGGIATPYSPYGASMNGAAMLGTERRGFLSRLFG